MLVVGGGIEMTQFRILHFPTLYGYGCTLIQKWGNCGDGVSRQLIFFISFATLLATQIVLRM